MKCNVLLSLPLPTKGRQETDAVAKLQEISKSPHQDWYQYAITWYTISFYLYNLKESNRNAGNRIDADQLSRNAICSSLRSAAQQS
jgi:cytochrome oxidase assembly protein ShyY1